MIVETNNAYRFPSISETAPGTSDDGCSTARSASRQVWIGLPSSTDPNRRTSSWVYWELQTIAAQLGRNISQPRRNWSECRPGSHSGCESRSMSCTKQVTGVPAARACATRLDMYLPNQNDPGTN